MTNEQILKKAIEKADFKSEESFRFLELIENRNVAETATEIMYIAKEIDLLIYSILFSHNFAKAFWGSELVKKSGEPVNMKIERERAKFMASSIVDVSNMLASWQYHLRIMVLEEEPLKYIKKFL